MPTGNNISVPKEEIPLVNEKYLLEKFPGKGGWTFARIPQILPSKKTPFGWVTVRGSIDNYEFSHYKMMPMGNGRLFLPIKAIIRREIKKEVGDWVHIILYLENEDYKISDDLSVCLAMEPASIQSAFSHLSDSKKKEINEWISASKNEEIKAKRILSLINNLETNC